MRKASTRQHGFMMGGLLAASVVCAALVEVRSLALGGEYYDFLIWNLFLAWLPLLLATAAHARARRRVPDLSMPLLLVLWLLFLPNAPYLLTDIIHLGEGTPSTLSYDAIMLCLFAATGLLLGSMSLYLVHMILRQIFDWKVAWLAVLTSLVLASFGVYIGRVIGFNSWDALVHPLHVAPVILKHLYALTLQTAVALLGLMVFLSAAYIAGYGFRDYLEKRSRNLKRCNAAQLP